MQNRIAYYILSLLHLNGSVRIPGLGRIRQERIASREDSARNLLIPPQIHTEFHDEDAGKGHLLEKYIAYRTNQSRIKARKEILRYARSVRALSASGLEGSDMLGRFQEVNGSLSLEPNTELTNPGTHLPEIPFTPLPGYAGIEEPEPEAILESAPGPAAPPPITFSLEEPQQEPLPAAPSSASPPDTPDTPPVTQPVTQEISHSSSPKRRQPDKTRTEEKEREWLGPVIGLALLALGVLAFLFFTGRFDRSRAVDPGTTVVQPEVPVISDTPGKAEDPEQTKIALADSGQRTEDITPSEVTNEAEDEVTATAATENTYVQETASMKSCMIVVGAFSMSVNAGNMKQKLQDMGFEVRTVQNGRLTQVGVPVDCEDAGIPDILDQLRSRVEPAAWLLRP